MQAASLPRFRQGRVANNRPPAQPAWRRWPVGRLFTTLRASVLHRALQTFRATRSMFTTLYAGLRRPEVTHTYARSLSFQSCGCRLCKDIYLSSFAPIVIYCPPPSPPLASHDNHLPPKIKLANLGENRRKTTAPAIEATMLPPNATNAPMV